jgi:hypothetical protein
LFPSFTGSSQYVPKSVPQRLKPSSTRKFTARLKPCPSFRVFPHLSKFTADASALGSTVVPNLLRVGEGLRCCRCFSKLSKLLNQEDALSGPCLRGDFCSPHAPSRSASIVRKGFIRCFRCHTTVCDQRVVILTSADAFPVVSGRCTGRACRCKARQRRRGMRTLIYVNT